MIFRQRIVWLYRILLHQFIVVKKHGIAENMQVV